ncbi:MAG: endonuclease/exonuclease/phosphatase family protein [Prevotella sp.]|nr:endonuclease/exonuclease/phosphatase family protein [Prevotella sp.]
MIKQLKKFVVQMLTGANIATIIVMLLVGYSDRLNPTDHPILSTVGMTFPFFLLANMAFLVFWLVFKWSRAWLPVVGFFLAYVPINIYIPLHTSQEVPDGTIKLISYNVCSYGGNYKYENGFEKVLGYLNDQQPDIVCIQEDADTWRRYVFKEYSKTFAYNDTLVLANNELTLNALGIHTRFPIVKRERIAYSSLSNGSAAWWLKVDNDTLIVINNHFESCHLSTQDRNQYRHIIKGEIPSDSLRTESQMLLVKLAEANAKRAGQIRTVRKYVESHPGYPVVLCGDFNDNPISYSRHTMSTVLTDCFVATGRGVGLSYNQKAFSFRIDHVFCSEDIQPFNCQVDSEMDASDHYPILCWLKIR